MTALNPRRIVLTLAGPVLALLVAFVVTSLVLVAVGDPVGDVWSTLLSKPLPRQMVNIVNAASVFYISAIAVAIGFRMNLFNIGVDGQYRVAVFAAAVFAGQAWLPGILNVIVAILIAMVCGVMSAAPTPWTTRAAMSISMEPDSPHQADASVKTARPTTNTGLGPYRSPRRPASRSSTA